jgi:hypothetical protein
MTAWGWLVMLASVGGTTAWLVWCLWKVVRTPGEAERLHGIHDEPPEEKR